MRIILLISGAKGAGKSTVTTMIQDLYPGAVELALANKLKKVCSDVFKVPMENFIAPNLKEVPFENPIPLNIFNVKSIYQEFQLEDKCENMKKHTSTMFTTPRKLLQYVGSELLRGKSPDIHCEFAAKNIDSAGVYIVSDIRFLNELNYFKNKYKWDCYPLYVQRASAEAEADKDKHISEAGRLELIKVSRTINNNGTLSDLSLRVESTFEDIIKSLIDFGT